ncbi:MAG: DUF1684 domain-containing protein [Opitutaceae bacterium]|nr:DUF1684 domain-containing protein [Opitutaceae bacterium]NBR58276.1 DUF1684 domain-containing protein [Opitutaceae bacterium]
MSPQSPNAVSALPADYPQTITTARAERVKQLTTPNGWLTLIGRHLISSGINTVGSAPDNSIILAAGPPYLGTVTLHEGTVTLTPAPSALLTINDQRIQQPTELIYKGKTPTVVVFGSVNFYVMMRGDSLFLRVKDREADRLKNFAGLDYFSLDLTWRLEATWIPFDPPHQVNITNMIGQTTATPVPGKAVFTRDGRTFELFPIDEGGAELFFVITDLTAGQETYGACRFLSAALPQNGKIILDFNQAENPPCAFTPFATCPLPPKENRLPIRVTAGEKNYRGEHH